MSPPENPAHIFLRIIFTYFPKKQYLCSAIQKQAMSFKKQQPYHPDMFKVPLLSSRSEKQLYDPKASHNQFYHNVYCKIPEETFRPLYCEGNGRPGASPRILCAMRVYKEGGGYSDHEMFDTLRFDILVRKSMGLMSLEAPVPTESIYYKFFAAICEYKENTGTDLYEQVCKHVTREQMREYNSDKNGEQMRGYTHRSALPLAPSKNVTETCVDEDKATTASGKEIQKPKLIVDIEVEPASTADIQLYEGSVKGSMDVTGEKSESVVAAMRRKVQEAILKAKRWLKNNVEAAMFQLTFHTCNNKTRYRGLMKQKIFALSRCLWVNHEENRPSMPHKGDKRTSKTEKYYTRCRCRNGLAAVYRASHLASARLKREGFRSGLMYGTIMIVLTFLCGSYVSAQDEIVFTPQWTAQAQFVGFYVAEAKGYYKDEGLNVRIVHPSPSNPCISRVKDGSSQIVTLQLPTAMHYIDQGLKLVNVLQVLQNNSQMIVSRRPLKSIHDLQGKRVATWYAGFNGFATVVARQQRVELEWVPFIQNVNLYVSKAVDATMAQCYNEFFQLKLAGQRFQDNQLIYLADIGCNIPEDGVYVTADYYCSHQREVRKFAEASRRGWEWAAQHPEEALDIVMNSARKAGVRTNRPAQKWMLNQILKLAVDRKTGKRTYRLEPAAVDLTNKLMGETGYLKRKVTYQEITEP